ncbi:MAG: PKD domain-containing protein, partial [Thermoplasmata archaeon]
VVPAQIQSGKIHSPTTDSSRLDIEGNWSVVTTEVYSNTDINLRGDLSVLLNGRLELYNCTLWMNCTGPGEFRIKVFLGGVLIMRNSTVRATTPAYQYNMVLSGQTEIDNSTIMNVYSTTLNWSIKGGIVIESSYVSIYNSMIKDCPNTAVWVDTYARPQIYNTTFYNVGQGIVSENNPLYIRDCLFNKTVSYGVAIWSANNTDVSPVLINNTGKYANVGFYFRQNSPVLRDNYFKNCDYGLYLYRTTNETIEFNYFEDCIYGAYTNQTLTRFYGNSFVSNERGLQCKLSSPYIIGNNFSANFIAFYHLKSNETPSSPPPEMLLNNFFFNNYTVYLNQSKNFMIHDNTFIHNNRSVSSYNSMSKVYNNNFDHSKIYTLYYYRSECEVYGNYINGTENQDPKLGHGIYTNTSSAQIYNNTIVNNSNDGIFMWATSGRVFNNIVSFNGDDGIYSGRSNNIAIFNNTVLNNTKHGIHLNNTNAVLVANNTAAANRGWGIYQFRGQVDNLTSSGNVFTTDEGWNNALGKLQVDMLLMIKVVDGDNNPIEMVNVSVFNNTELVVPLYEGLTAAHGWVVDPQSQDGKAWQMVITILNISNSGVVTRQGPFRINATKDTLSVERTEYLNTSLIPLVLILDPRGDIVPENFNIVGDAIVTEGEVRELEVYIRNSGHSPINNTSFPVKFYVGNTLFREVTLENITIEVGEVIRVNASGWVATPGEKSLRVIIGNSSVNESDRNNNVAYLDIVVNRYPVPVMNIANGTVFTAGVNFTLNASLSTDDGPLDNDTQFLWIVGGAYYPGKIVSAKIDVFGNYTITLKVTDIYGKSNSTTISIVVNAPPEPFIRGAANDTSMNLIFFDASQSYDPEGQPFKMIEWDMGDGRISREMTFNYSYAKPGVYNVTLTIWDSYNAKASLTKQITIFNRKPSAQIRVNGEDRTNVTVQAGNILFLNGSYSYDPDGVIVNYTWYLNGTAIAWGPAFNITANGSGSYVLVLNITDDFGDSSTDTLYIIMNAPPVAASNLQDGLVIQTGRPFRFNASNSTDPNTGDRVTGAVWDFGDGVQSEGMTIEHIYFAGGEYRVNLTVFDSYGASSKASYLIRVNTAPVANAGSSVGYIGPNARQVNT